MLYPKNKEKSLSDSLFQNPTSEYRGTPFWAWNCKIEKEEALRQIDCLKEMGFGGFHIHSRTGLDTPYLGKEFMDAVKACCDKAEAEKMLCWLYDEDRWPSGAAGGYVTKNPEYRARKLLFSPSEKELCKEEDGGPVKLLARYAVTLSDGYLSDYRRLGEKEDAADGEDLWYAYLEVNENHDPWFNDFAYADTLNKKAIDEFIRVTHEKYYSVVGDRFSTVVPAIFSDEPQFNGKCMLRFPTEKIDVRIPYTTDLDETFFAEYGVHLLDHLPEIFWEPADGVPSLVRYHYHDHTAERFARAFADNIGKWCQDHNLMMTGHMMEEPTLESQSAVLGDAMRSYRGFQLPGIDMLCDQREFTTAKQAQSAAHQYGRPGVLSELYGVTNWDFDFRGHKLQGDWQAALGVTVRVPHLAWMSMAGEAKRDFPASISFQSPWYRDYRYIEDHYARINTALTRGNPLTKIGVIHPVESYWLHYGNNEQTARIRGEMERNFSDITNWLLFGLLDFDFICESLLPTQCPDLPHGKTFPVGKMAYDVVIVPGCETIRRTTFERLAAFRRAGGRVLFLGQIPKYVDAVPTDEVLQFADECEQIAFSKIALLKALENIRQIDLIDRTGNRPETYISQMRQDGDDRWLFLGNGTKEQNPDISIRKIARLMLNGNWDVTLYDTMNGEIKPLSAQHDNGITVIEMLLYSYDSILLRLSPAASKNEIIENAVKAQKQTAEFRVIGPVPVSLDEPNVLLLDQAEYSLDGGEWRAREEVLRLDNIVREMLGFPSRCTGIVQPWTVHEMTELSHQLRLRFRFDCRIEGANTTLAIENIENTRIFLNGTEVNRQVTGWYVDPCLKTVSLPTLQKGENVLELSIAYGRKTDVEWCYLLGDFGVNVAGDTAYLTDPVKELYFSNAAAQGLPFYGGNLTYHIKTQLPDGHVSIRAERYRGAALKASLDGEDNHVFAFSPYICDLGKVENGEHEIRLTVLGSRVNSFGQVHNCNLQYGWYGPDSWRTVGCRWSYEYELRQTGLLKAPEILVFDK